MGKGFKSKLITLTNNDAPLQLIMATIAADPALEVETGLLDTDSAIAEYGFFNEFGTANIPARSFIRSTFDENRDSYIKKLERDLTKAMRKGTPLRSAMIKLGNRQRNDIIKKITKLKIPANALSTQRKKGRGLSKAKGKTVLVDNPLIDTGVMRVTIRWRVSKP